MEPIEIRLHITIHEDGSISLSNPDSGKKEMKLKEVPGLNDFGIEVAFFCSRWALKVNKKPARSCKGCTVQCHLRDKYKGERVKV